MPVWLRPTRETNILNISMEAYLRAPYRCPNVSHRIFTNSHVLICTLCLMYICIMAATLNYVWACFWPRMEYPSCRHTTVASILLHESSHTVPHTLLLIQISTLPSFGMLPPSSCSWPVVQGAASKIMHVTSVYTSNTLTALTNKSKFCMYIVPKID